MLMDTKGRLFGKISIVDIIVVLLVIVAAVGAYVRFGTGNKNVISNDSVFYYTININGIRESNKNALLNSVGEKFELDGKIKSSMGTLTDIAVSDSVDRIDMTNGDVVMANVPEKYDVVLTLMVQGNVNDNGYFTPESYEICAGKSNCIKNRYCMITGVIDKVWE